MLKINNKIIFPAILLVIVIAVALFFILQFKTIKPNEPQPGGKILTQEEMIKFYQELSDTVPGTKKYINPYTLVENLGNGKFQAEISSVPKINQDGEEINIAWAQKEEGLFEGGNNFFAVSVNGANTMVSAIYDLSEGIKKGDIAKWNPQIFLNEKEVMPISDTPILLKNDPYNKNYHNNVLEWDYGICKRQLRLIEGNILEFYIFALNPNGDIEIKSNISGNLRASAPYAIDAKKNPLESFRIDGDRKILSSSSFDSVDYPVVIDDSYVGSSSLEDGDLMPIGSTNYSSVWNLYTADYVRTYDLSVGQYSTSQGKYRIMRGFVYFDTSAIPSTATISAATLGLMSGSPGPGSFNVVIQSGQPSHPQIPLSGSDFYKGYYSGNGGQIGSSAFNTNFGLYVNIPMSSQGIGWIQKGTGAITKLCLRSSNDISGIFYEEYIYPYTAETGSGYEPKLSVTYTLPNPTISVTPASLNFGNVNNGAYYNMDFTVQNTGGGALLGSVSGLTAPFSCFNGCTYNLTAGASQSTTIKFSPTSVGSFSGTVVFSGAAGASRPVSGNGITPKCIPTGTTNTNYTISTATLGGSTLCEITGDDGVEGGNLTIGTGVTVQINANSRLIFNNLKSIVVDGIIAKSATNAKIVKGNLVASTLSTTLSASPSSGTAPLNGVDFTASVSGTATGNIRYRFDCTNDGIYELDQTTSATSYTATDICNYSSIGTYTAAIRVDRGGTTAYNWATITVSPACTCSSGACCDGCNYRSSSYVCRASAGACDVTEYCTGSSTTCPSDSFNPSSYVCNTWTEYDYQCTGTTCGSDPQSMNRTNSQKCSGSGANCNGTITYGTWSSWSSIEDCVSTTDKCLTDNATYAYCNYDTSCLCTNECSSSGCSGTTYNNCYDSDGDGCTESHTTNCSTSCYSCGNGVCNSSCGETASNCSSDCAMNCAGACEWTGGGYGLCQSGSSPFGCGAPSQCDGRSPHVGWTDDNVTCKACGFCDGGCCTSGTCAQTANINCAYTTDTTKEPTYFASGSTCYYNCVNHCVSDSWTARAYWSVYLISYNGMGAGNPDCSQDTVKKTTCTSTGWR